MRAILFISLLTLISVSAQAQESPAAGLPAEHLLRLRLQALF